MSSPAPEGDDWLVGPGVAGGATTAEIIPAILQACPSFEARWQEHLEYWNGEAAGLYLDAAEVAHHFIALLLAGQHDQLIPGLAAVEDLLGRTDRDARAILIVGIVEDMQTISSHHEGAETALLPLLGPQTRAAWERVSAYWSALGARTLMDVIRAEMRAGGPGQPSPAAPAPLRSRALGTIRRVLRRSTD